jgi:hypothetical protein
MEVTKTISELGVPDAEVPPVRHPTPGSRCAVETLRTAGGALRVEGHAVSPRDPPQQRDTGAWMKS